MLPKDLRGRSFLRFAGLLACDWLVIVGAFSAASRLDHWSGYLACWFVVGTRQHALAILAHEGTHELIHENRWLNGALAKVLCFWPIFQLSEGYSPWHVTHHRFLGTAQDSEHPVRCNTRFVLPTHLSRLVLTFTGDLLGLGAPALLLQMSVIRPRGGRALLLAYLGPLCLWTLATCLLARAGLGWIPLLWLVALPTSFWAVFRVREFFEHTGSSGTHRFHLGVIGRFCFAPNYTFLHYEHHKWPFIPCYRLPAARELDVDEPVLSIWQLIRLMEQTENGRVEPTAVDQRKQPESVPVAPLGHGSSADKLLS